MELISKEEVLKIFSRWTTDYEGPGDVCSTLIYTGIKDEINALPSVEPEKIKANVKRLYRYEKAAAKKRDGNG